MRRSTTTTLAAAGLALVLSGCGGSTGAGSYACKRAHEASDEFARQAKVAQTLNPGSVNAILLQGAYVLDAEPSCFSVEDVATARAFIKSYKP